MLSKRHHDILKLVVHAHIEGGEPVGSKTVCERSRLGLSPATIRNAMVELEEMGFLSQPHPSAGREPTDRGFRQYVDTLLDVSQVSREEKERLMKACEMGGADLDGILTEVSRVLSSLTPNACLVRTPGLNHTVLRRVQFLKLAPGGGRRGSRILALVVSDSGQLMSRIFYLEEVLSQRDLDRFGRSLSRHMEGMNLLEVREHLRQEVERSESEYRTLCNNLLESVTGTGSGSGLIVNGRMNIFSTSLDLARIREMLTVLEEKRALIRLMDACLFHDGVQLFIGSESRLGSTNGCTVVAAHFNGPGRMFPGALGVLGPTRLDYAHVIPLVDFTANLLSTFLSEAPTSQTLCATPGSGRAVHISETEDEGTL